MILLPTELEHNVTEGGDDVPGREGWGGGGWYGQGPHAPRAAVRRDQVSKEEGAQKFLPGKQIKFC
jgi:hypothetical protein